MTFSVLGLTGYWYGLIAGVSTLAYLCLAGVLGYVRRLPAGTVRWYGLFALPMGLLFARLGYCAVNYSYFTESVSQPWLMLHFWDGGYSLIGALCGLFLAALLTAKIRKVRFGVLLDVSVAPIGLLLIGLRLAEAFTDGQLGIGRQVEATSLAQIMPWLFVTEKMGTLTLLRMAVYRYEAAAAALLLVLSLVLFFGRTRDRKTRAGDTAMLVYALFGAMQIILESLRDDGHMVAGFIRVQQLACALIPLVVLAILGVRYAHIRQIRKTAVAAWLLLPAVALVGYLMIRPINHVLDLTSHRVLGGVLLAGLAVYLLFFLRVRGADLRLIITWLAAIAAILCCVMVEFSVDGSNNLLRDYGIMAACCLALFLAPYTMWRKLKQGVYGEESLRIQIPAEPQG